MKRLKLLEFTIVAVVSILALAASCPAAETTQHKVPQKYHFQRPVAKHHFQQADAQQQKTMQQQVIPAKDGNTDSQLTVFVAKKIITMEPSMPVATAVAVYDGKIVSVGTLESLQGWIDAKGATIDRTFEDKILMPGLIDPHVHPSLPAVLTQFPFIAPDDWVLPTGVFPGAKTQEAYIARLKELVTAYYDDPEHDPKIPFITWGFHQLWHGDVYRDKLNELFGDKPVMLWQRSFHEMVGNDAAFKLLGVSEADVKDNPEIDWKNGHFWENGLMSMLPKMGFLFAPARYETGMENFVAMMHLAGVTSAMDMGMGIFGDPIGETALIHKVIDGNNKPVRIVLTPFVTDFLARKVSIPDAMKQVEKWTKGNSHQVMYDGHFKLMMDGAIYSGASMYNFPGYMDGHKGQWMAPPETTYKWARAFWDAGYQLHAHTNGDKSAAALIDMLRRLQFEKPRFDHRFSLEHFAYVTEDQVRQMKELGMITSVNPYYQYILADIYADKWLGPDRAKKMVPLGAAKRYGVSFSLHSDCPMAPLSPLTLAWTAVNRVTINGNQNFESENITVHDAMRAITIDAAWAMRWEDKIGSIIAGKNADFAVLEQDPYEVDPMKLKDIPVWGTVFEGKVYPVKQD